MKIMSSDPSRRVFADLHVHLLINEWHRRSPYALKYPLLFKFIEKFMNPTSLDWKKCHRAGFDLLCSAHYNFFDEILSMPTDPNPEACLNTISLLDWFERELEGKYAPFAKLAHNHWELRDLLAVPKTHPDFRVAVIHCLEGGHALGGSLKPLEQFARRGVALITLTHFFNKGIASTVDPFYYFPDNSSTWPNQGLSEFGHKVIKEMERLGMIVDIAHASVSAVEDILKASTNPLVATHSSIRTLGDHAYSLYDEHVLEIAHRGGLIGIFLYPYWLSNYSGPQIVKKWGSLKDVVRTIRYVYKICGSHKPIVIGSDISGYITGPKEISQLEDISKLHQSLLAEFDGDEKLVEDIMANNVIEFLLKHWRSGI